MSRHALSLFALLAVSAAAGRASAFCQTYTCEFEGADACDRDPVTGCKVGGVVAHWETACIGYAVQAQGSRAQGISAAAVRRLLDEGFRAWSDVECPGGGTPRLSAAYRGETACEQVEYDCGAGNRNQNIVVFRDGSSDLSDITIALSTIIANLRTGEILDVDIEINSQDFDFYTDPAGGRFEETDLGLVINHELGHLLGLSHSTDPDALMHPEYAGSDREPAEDDVRGICRALAPAEADPVCELPRIAGAGECVGNDSACGGRVQQASSCSLAGPQSISLASPAPALGAAWASAVALLWLRVRRRRRSHG